MPTYDYKCMECGHRFEAFQKMSDTPLTSCPECQGPVQRLLSGGSGLIFKGSGFYITDYAKKNSSNSSPTPPATQKTETSKQPSSQKPKTE